MVHDIPVMSNDIPQKSLWRTGRQLRFCSKRKHNRGSPRPGAKKAKNQQAGLGMDRPGQIWYHSRVRRPEFSLEPPGGYIFCYNGYAPLKLARAGFRPG